MEPTKARANGGAPPDGCAFTMHEAETLLEGFADIQRSSAQTLISLDRKMDKLIDAISGKDMMPISTLRWIVIFMIVFTFTMVFGVDAAKELTKSTGKIAASALGQAAQ